MSKSIKISGKILSRYNEIVSDEALKFIQEIHEKFNHKRLELLSERKKRQNDIDNGGKLDFFACPSGQQKMRYKLWKGISWLNGRHMFWAWISMIWVGFTDIVHCRDSSAII